MSYNARRLAARDAQTLASTASLPARSLSHGRRSRSCCRRRQRPRRRGGGDPLNDRLRQLQTQKKALEDQKNGLQKEAKAEARERKRVIETARTLSDQDLLAVVQARAVARPVEL